MENSKSGNLFGVNPNAFKKQDRPVEYDDDESGNYNDASEEFVVDTKNEQLLLGQAINNNRNLQTFVMNCGFDEFQVENHKVLAWCLHKAHEDNLEVNDDLFEVLKYDYPNKENSTGGISYIAKLRKAFNDNLSESNYMVHVRKFKLDSIKSKVADAIVRDLVRFSRDPKTGVEKLAEINATVEALIQDSVDMEKRGFKTMHELNTAHDSEVQARTHQSAFISTGFSFLDDLLTDGFAQGRVTILAGRPGMAKSTFVANSMVRLSNRKHPVATALFALEMDGVSMVDRMNAIETDIDLKRLIKDRVSLTNTELKAETDAKKRREKKPIYICDDVRKSLIDVKREVKALREKYGVKVVYIDLFMKLKKMYGTGNKSTADQYTEMLNEVQRIARELHVHICLVVQIGRKVEARTDKRPTISDLKDSGAYEEIADNIFLFYREAYYMTKSADEEFESDILEIIIGKQRQGTTGTVKALFNGATTKIQKAHEEDIEAFDKMIANLKPQQKGKRGEY